MRGLPLVPTSWAPHSPALASLQADPPACPSPLRPCRTVMGPGTACQSQGNSSRGTQGSHKLQEMKAPERCLLLTHNSSLIMSSPGHNVGNQSWIPRGGSTAPGLWSEATSVGEALRSCPSPTEWVGGVGRGAGDPHSMVMGPPDLH